LNYTPKENIHTEKQQRERIQRFTKGDVTTDKLRIIYGTLKRHFATDINQAYVPLNIIPKATLQLWY
jgi:hypothetical protein